MIDLHALGKFQDLLKPIFEAIDSVKTLEAHKADLERAVEGLKRDIANKQDALAALGKAAVAKAAEMQDAVNKAEVRKAQMLDEATAGVAEAKEKADAAERAANERLAAVKRAIATKNEELASIATVFAEKRKQLQEGLDAIVAEQQEVERKRAAAEKALAAIRAKLG